MKLLNILQIIEKVAKDNNFSRPLIVGGVPRQKMLQQFELGVLNLDTLHDVDITTGDNDVHLLAKAAALELRKQTDHYIPTRQANDGHFSIYFKNDFKLDFSSNFLIPNIENILLEKKIKPTPMRQELYSRDFTCNTLLMSLDFKYIIDPLHLAIPDIKNQILKTCLAPEITFAYNTNRIARVIYLAVKLNFEIDSTIKTWIQTHPEMTRKSTTEYNTKMLRKALAIDSSKTLALITELNLWGNIPIFKEIEDYYLEQVIKKKAQFFTNYDLNNNPTGPGASVYTQMDKFKSIQEFRKKTKKRRKKQREMALKTKP